VIVEVGTDGDCVTNIAFISVYDQRIVDCSIEGRVISNSLLWRRLRLSFGIWSKLVYLIGFGATASLKALSEVLGSHVVGTGVGLSVDLSGIIHLYAICSHGSGKYHVLIRVKRLRILR
jgi:hypothetical protein